VNGLIPSRAGVAGFSTTTLIEVVNCSHEAILEFLFGCHTDVAQDGLQCRNQTAFHAHRPWPYRADEISITLNLFRRYVMADKVRALVEGELERVPAQLKTIIHEAAKDDPDQIS
jgi:hypothetical protein